MKVIERRLKQLEQSRNEGTGNSEFLERFAVDCLNSTTDSIIKQKDDNTQGGLAEYNREMFVVFARMVSDFEAVQAALSRIDEAGALHLLPDPAEAWTKRTGFVPRVPSERVPSC